MNNSEAMPVNNIIRIRKSKSLRKNVALNKSQVTTAHNQIVNIKISK